MAKGGVSVTCSLTLKHAQKVYNAIGVIYMYIYDKVFDIEL